MVQACPTETLMLMYVLPGFRPNFVSIPPAPFQPTTNSKQLPCSLHLDCLLALSLGLRDLGWLSLIWASEPLCGRFAFGRDLECLLALSLGLRDLGWLSRCHDYYCQPLYRHRLSQKQKQVLSRWMHFAFVWGCFLKVVSKYSNQQFSHQKNPFSKDLAKFNTCRTAIMISFL